MLRVTPSFLRYRESQISVAIHTSKPTIILKNKVLFF